MLAPDTKTSSDNLSEKGQKTVIASNTVKNTKNIEFPPNELRSKK
jgi:hypothetical protein